MPRNLGYRKTAQREKNVIKDIRTSNIPCTIIDYFVEPEEIIEVLKHADFCLSGRFHATIFSALANTPFIGFRANTHKIAALIEMLEYPIPELILGETDISKIIFYVKMILENKNSIKSSLGENVSKAKKISKENNIKVLEGKNIKKSLIKKIRDEVEFLIQSINPKEWHRW
jgi:polysaccharide pyruvyl transferase WcaK-like protein